MRSRLQQHLHRMTLPMMHRIPHHGIAQTVAHHLRAAAVAAYWLTLRRVHLAHVSTGAAPTPGTGVPLAPAAVLDTAPIPFFLNPSICFFFPVAVSGL